MTQLGELRDAYSRFQDAGIKLYALSYDEVDALAAFAEANAIPFPLLSDPDSAVIRKYGILNTDVGEHELPFFGVPHPGTYVVDEEGVIVEKFFPRHIAMRESADSVLESALGKLLMGESDPRASGGADGISVTAFFHGGGGSLKNAILRKVVVRFELPDGLHIYGEPVPESMVAMSVGVSGPDGLVVEDAILPPTTPLKLEGLDIELQVWSGTVDIVVPVWANSHLIHIFDPTDERRVQIDVTVRYQACNHRTCLFPRTEKLSLTVDIAPLDVPDIPGANFETNRITKMDSMTHLTKMVERSK